MRKLLYLAMASCVALVAFMGFSTTAMALVDQDCDGSPYNNSHKLRDVQVDAYHDELGTQLVTTQLTPAYLIGSAIVCGGELNWFGPTSELNSLTKIAHVLLPRSMVITPTGPGTSVPVGSYAGKGTARVLNRTVGMPTNPEEPLNLRVDNKNGSGVDCPSNAIACTKGSSTLGYSWTWITTYKYQGVTRKLLNIGKVYAVAGESGLTKITFNECKYFGATGSGNGSCGSSGTVQIGTGAFSVNSQHTQCQNTSAWQGRGSFVVRATDRGNVNTPLVKFCKNWTQ